MKIIRLTNVLVLLLISSLMAQESESLNEAFKTHLQKDYFKLNLLIQSEGRFSFHDDDFQGGRTFSVPNARISLRGKLDSGFFYRLFVDAAPRPTLLDAYVGYNLDEACKISVGAMKPRQTLDFIAGSTEYCRRRYGNAS
ncbi:MAG: porin [Fidelibacterota bacterium]